MCTGISSFPSENVVGLCLLNPVIFMTDFLSIDCFSAFVRYCSEIRLQLAPESNRNERGWCKSFKKIKPCGSLSIFISVLIT